MLNILFWICCQLRFIKTEAKKHHFSIKKLSVRKQLFHKTIIWHQASASTVIFMKNIKPECAWITEIPTLARFSCSTFENFLCTGTLLVPRVHCYTCTSSGQQMWEQGKKVENKHLGDLSSIEKHLYYAYLHRNYAAILVTLHIIVESSTNCAEPVWQDLGITSDLFGSPISPHACLCLSLSPFWSLSLSLLPSSSISVNPTVTEALSADAEMVLQQDNKGDKYLTATCDGDKISLQCLLKNACWSSDVYVLHVPLAQRLSSPNFTLQQTSHAFSVMSVMCLVLKTGQLKHFSYVVAHS